MSLFRRLDIPTATEVVRPLTDAVAKIQDAAVAAFSAIERSWLTRYQVPERVSAAGYLARPGQLVRMIAAVELLLATPTPDTRGIPTLVYNDSDGVVLVRPVGATVNGQDLTAFVEPGLHTLVNDGEAYYCDRGVGPAVEFVSAGSLAGVTTGNLSITAPSEPTQGSGGMLLAPVAIQGTGGASSVQLAASNFRRYATNTNSTVRIELWGEHELLGTGDNTGVVSIGDLTTDLLGFALWLANVDHARRVGPAVITDGSGTTLTSGSITTTRPGAMILDFMANDDETDTGTPGTGQTEIVDGSAGSATVSLQASYKPMPVPGTTTMSWSGLTNAANKAHIAIVIEPALLS